MEEQAARLRPGMPQHTKLTWKRCGALRWLGDEPCGFNGEPILICSRCWDDGKTFAGLTVIGPLTAPVGISCERCGGQDSEVQADTGIPSGYTEAMARIAEWNATIERRIERRKQCDTPFGWLPLWHPGAW
jgi:ribosomal protein L37E